MIANDPNVTMAEKMAYSRHSNPSSHIAYIRAGHNSDFAFQKAVSGAPMPKKKAILQQKSVVTNAAKMAKRSTRKRASRPRKVTCSKAMAIRKATPPKELAYLKAPPKSSVSRPATRSAAIRRSVRVHKPKKFD
jgi:hypothetical protein